jgi:gliding motility-associated-like protein
MIKFPKNIIVTSLFLFISICSYSQNISGRDFWFTMPENNGGTAADNDYIVTLVSDYCADYTIEMPALGWIQSGTIVQGVPNDIIMPKTISGQILYHNRNNYTQGKGIHVTSDQTVTVYMFMMTPASSDAETVIPTNMLGTEYVVGFNSSMRPNSTAFARTTVVATEDNTDIVIDTWTNGAGAAGAPGTPLQVKKTLNRGETYQWRQTQSNSSADFQTTFQTWGQTGSRVVANKRIAVVSSVPCSDMADCGPCDGMMTMVTPVSQWDNRFIIAQAMKRGDRQYCGDTDGVADFVQVIGKIGTNVTIQSLTGTFNFVIPAPSYAKVNHYGYGYFVYNNSPYDDGSLLGGPEANGEANMIVTADQPIEIIQYMKAGGYDSDVAVTAVNLDPEAIVVYPESFWESSYLFTNASGGFAARTSPTATIVIRNDALPGKPDPIDDLLLDGDDVNGLPYSAVWQAFGPPDSNYMFTRVAFVTLRSHQIISTSGYKFGIYIYATAAAESYVYQGGQSPILATPCPSCPVAEFTAPANICLGESALFTDKSKDPNFNIVKWSYDFGDTIVDTRNVSFNPTHTYAYSGLQNTTLSIINDATPPCTTQYFYSVDVKPLPTYNPGIDTSKCKSDTLLLDFGDAAPTEGTSPFTYVWTPATDIDNTGIIHPSIYPETANTYNVKVTDFYGCEYDDDIKISIGRGDSIFMSQDSTICLGGDAILTFRLVTVIPGYDYDVTITDGTTNFTILNLLDGHVKTIVNPLLTADYTIISADPSNGDESCIVIQEEPVNIAVRPLPDVTFAPDTTICLGQDVDIRFELTGDGGPWEVTYHDDNTTYTETINGTQASFTHSPISTMVYALDSVKYTDDPGCKVVKTDQITINVNTIPTVSWVVPTPICQEDTVQIQFTITDGVAPYYVLYETDGVLDSVLFNTATPPTNLPVWPSLTTTYKLIGIHAADEPYCMSYNTEEETIVVEAVFKAGRDSTLDICTSEPQDLFILLGPDADNVGVWTDIDGSGGALDPAGIYDPAGVTTGIYRFTYYIDNNAPCVDQLATITLNIYENPTASFLVQSEICAESDADLTFTLTGTGPFNLDMEKDNSPFTLFGYNHGQIFSETLNITTDYELITITDASPAACTATINQLEKVIVNDAPQLSLDSNECDAAGENYIIYLDVTGGDPLTYQELPGSTPAGGSFYELPVGSGNWKYKSASLATQTFPNLIIDDAKVCGTDPWTKGHACDCKSDAGEIEASAQNICGNDSTSITETAPVFLDGNDVSEYYMYTSFVNNDLVDVLDSNATGVFSFKPATMTYGTTYYVARLVGTEADPVPTGTIDRKDLCLSYSSAIPVTFYPTPAATWLANSPVCFGDVSTIDVELTTGSAPYSVTYNPGGSSAVLNNLMDVVNLTASQLPVGNNTFDLINITDDNGCQLNALPIASSSMVVNPLPTIAITTLPANATICEDDNIDFTFAFTGASPFDINYVANTIAQTDIDSVPDGYIHTFTPTTTTDYVVNSVKDNNGCIGGTDNVLVTVNSNPTYTIIYDKDEMCEGDVATITFNITGGNSDYEIAYTSDNTDDVGSSLTGLQNGSTYALSPARGSYHYDFGDIKDGSATICSSSQIVGYDLIVYPSPQVAISLASAPVICAGDSIILTFTTSEGTGPFNVTYEDNLNNNYATGSFGANGITGETFNDTNAQSNAGIIQFYNVNVTDASGICVGSSTDTVTVEVLRIPTYTVAGGGEFCEGYTSNIVITPLGDRDMLLTYVNPENGGTSEEYQVPYQNTKTNFPVAPINGGSDYTFGGIKYEGIPACQNNMMETIKYTINDIPSAYLQNDVVICAGESIDLQIRINGGVPPFQLVYNDGVSDINHSVTIQDGSTIAVSPSETTTYTLVSITDLTATKCEADFTDATTKVTVNPLPVGTITSPEGICLNETVEVSINVLTGKSPFLVTVSDEFGTGQRNPIVARDTIIYSPSNAGLYTYEIVKIEDATVSSVTGKACISDLLVTTMTRVNPLPSGTIELLQPEICEYEVTSFSANITSGSQGPYNLYYTINNVAMQEFGYNSGDPITISTIVDGKYGIVLYKIEDSASPYSCTSDPGFSITDTLVVNPTPLVAFKATEYGSCNPLETMFINNTDSKFQGKAEWSLGRGKVSTEWDNVNASYTSSGYYDIELTVTSNEGCMDTLLKEDYVQVYPDPVVDFIYQPNPATLSNSGIRFQNTTVGGHLYKWYVDTISGNEETSYISPEGPATTEDDHYYYFNDEAPGEYQVLLESWSSEGCDGNKSKIVSINGELLVNIPNSFTPNGDGVNDYFKPYMFGNGESFSFKVFNRWGEEVFSTSYFPSRDENVDDFGWDGKHMKTGEEMKIDTYIYRIIVENKFNQKKEEFFGEVNLLR